MSKKIIAFCCVLVLVVTCFVACGKKYLMLNVDGAEYPLATDAEGNTVVDVEGFLAVYVTDEHGKNVTDQNGENGTNFITFPNQILEKGGSTLETAYYSVSMPEGWALNDNNEFEWKKNKNITIEFMELSPLTTDRTIDSYISAELQALENLEEKEEYKDKISHNFSVCKEITQANCTCAVVHMEEKDDSGNIVAYNDLYYIDLGGKLLQVSYACKDSANLELFDSYALINDNLVIK